MRTGIRITLALLALGFAGQALATNYYYCYVRDSAGNKLRYYTEIMSTPGEIHEQNTAFAYFNTLSAQLMRDYPGDISGMAKCSSSTNLGYLQKEWKSLPQTWPGVNPQIVAFVNPPVPSTPVRESTPGPHLTIEEKKPVGPTPEQLAAQAAEQRRVDAAEAQRRAAAAAQAAKTDAKWQALLEAERERRRQCPSCQ